MPVSELSQAREAQKIAAGPLVPGVMAGHPCRRSLRLHSARRFRLSERCSASITEPPPIEHC